jgi:hypothetical protein
MQRILAIAAVAVAAAAAACRLDPLVDDMPGASANVLPGSATIKTADQNADLLNQITLNDGFDDKVLAAASGVIKRLSGQSGGGTVMYWAFGPTRRAPAPIYIFGTGDPMSASFQPNEHLPLVDAVPGDSEYNPVHTIYRVAVTNKYRGEKITTTGALADAIQLGLVQAPLATRVFVNWPIVRPGLKLEVGGSNMVKPPSQLYGHGYIVEGFQLGGALGLQPAPFGLLPTAQVSLLREPQQGGYDPARPIFQAVVPTTAAGYTPVSIVVNVDVPQGAAAGIHSDGDLFTRSPMTGEITGTRPVVLQFTVTATTVDLQLQFEDGVP